jgi:hypothetical protein
MVLIIEGKKTLGEQVKNGQISFSNFILADNYFLTAMDLWILVQKYKIPAIFLCQKTILQTNHKKHVFVGYKGNEGDNYALIMLPAFRAETIPKLKIIVSNDNTMFFKMDILKKDCYKCNEKPSAACSECGGCGYVRIIEPTKCEDCQGSGRMTHISMARESSSS